jgi:peptide-methionine (S)-S-oxide reductase
MMRMIAGMAALLGVAFAIPNGQTPAPRDRATAVLAGGCFWGIEAVYEHVRGVIDVVSGYAGGSAEDADYMRVSTGRTGHAESVRIVFNPSVVSYEELLDVFFAVAHDPTQRNRQGPDVGPQYRSVVFFANAEQASSARARVDSLTRAGVFSDPIVTEVTPLDEFYPAEEYHQDYATRHPNDPYIVIHDLPKIGKLRARFPAMFRDR